MTLMDLAIFEQSLWSTLNYGLLLWNTAEFGVHFRVHFDPILFFLLPFYILHQSPITLLVLQSVFLGLGALPLYYLAKNELKSDIAGVVFSLSYLLYPPIQGVNWFDFHPECLLPFFLITAFYYFKKNNFYRYFLFLVLALMCKETVATITVFMGVYGVWLNRRSIDFRNLKFRRLVSNKGLVSSVFTIILSVSWYLTSTRIIKAFNPLGYLFQNYWFYLGTPIIRGGGLAYLLTMVIYYHYYSCLSFGGCDYTLLDYLLWLLMGNISVMHIVNNILLNPLQVIEVILTPYPMKSYYFSVLFTPLLYLPLLDPASLFVAASWIVLNSLSLYPWYFSPVGFQYPALYTPFLFIAAVNGFSNLTNILKKSVRYFSDIPNERIRRIARSNLVCAFSKNFLKIFCIVLLVASIISVVNWSPLWNRTNPTPHDQALEMIANILPPYSSVCVQPEIYPHISHSLLVYPYYYPWFEYDYILGDSMKSGYYTVVPAPHNLILNATPLSNAIPNLVASGKYGVLISFNGIVLLKRGYNGSPFISL